MNATADMERRLLSNPVIAELLHDFTISNREREASAAKADPAKHKLTRVTNDTSYRYWGAGQDGMGREVRFCWTTHRNVAGYFLGWREVVGKKATKRDKWIARKSRAAATELSRRRQNAFIAKAERKA